MRADSSIQFTLTRPAPPPEPPAWLRTLGRWLADLFAPIGRLLRWVSNLMPDAPYARIILWGMLAAAAAALVWIVVDRIRSGEWRLPRRRRRPPTDQDPQAAVWVPEAAPARAWLKEADALAAKGRYAEAIHHLLFRSIEDIGRRRPHTVRPALTSRELAAHAALPPAVRTLFAAIARMVERSLFGGRPVAADDWHTARVAYADLVLPGTWRR